MRTGLVWHERYMWHDTGSGASELPSGGWLEPHVHAESPDTKRRLKNLLDATGLTERLVAVAAARGDDRGALPRARPRVRRPHPRACRKAAAATPAARRRSATARSRSPLLAAGGTIAAVDAVLDGAVDNAYALVRPPGHHALPGSGMGFCLFGNVAVAVRHAQAARALGRIAVVDWDVHHGNGTQAVFWEDASVLADLAAPGRLLSRALRARLEENGAGAGDVAQRSTFRSRRARGEAPIVDALERVVVPALERFRPELIVVACGFDAGALDPLGRMQLSAARVRRNDGARSSMRPRRLCDGRLVASHEGGYSAGHVPFCGLATIEALSGESAGIVDPFAYLGGIPGQELLPHQAAAVDRAAVLVEAVPL